MSLLMYLCRNYNLKLHLYDSLMDLTLDIREI